MKQPRPKLGCCTTERKEGRKKESSIIPIYCFQKKKLLGSETILLCLLECKTRVFFPPITLAIENLHISYKACGGKKKL